MVWSKKSWSSTFKRNITNCLIASKLLNAIMRLVPKVPPPKSVETPKESDRQSFGYLKLESELGKIKRFESCMSEQEVRIYKVEQLIPLYFQLRWEFFLSWIEHFQLQTFQDNNFQLLQFLNYGFQLHVILLRVYGSYQLPALYWTWK